MSIQRIQALIAELPLNFRDPVVGYARSVEAALPEIFRDARVELTPTLADEVVFIAGIRKLYAMVSSTFRTLDTALTALRERQIPAVRIGGRKYSFDSPEYGRLRALDESLRAVLQQQNLLRFMRGRNYASVIQILAHERRENQ